MSRPKKFDKTKTIEQGYRPIYIGSDLTMVCLEYPVGNMKALEGFCATNLLNSSRIAKLQGGYYLLNSEERWERLSRTLGELTFGMLYDNLINLGTRIREHYIIVRGDDIITSTNNIEDAIKEFDKIPLPERPSQKRTIYKLVKED